MRIQSLCLFLALLLTPAISRADPVVRQWIVVVAPAYRDAVAPLAAHRRTEGMKVVVLSTRDVLNAEEIKTGQAQKLCARVNQLCQDHPGPSAVLLVGSIRPSPRAEDTDTVVPAMRGTIGRMKNEPSDNPYGNPDRDLLPRVAVGRFPVRTVEEAKALVQKTLAFEKDQRPATWRTRMTILAGIPAFNPVVDRLVESQAMARFDRLDPAWHGQAIYHNPTSRFCVADNRLSLQAKDYLKQGQAFTFYFGHSSPEGFYAEHAHYLDRDDWSQLSMGPGQGVFCTFGCLGCQLQGLAGEGYGVAAVRNPNGPVAVIGSHGICFAAMVQLAADALFEKTFSGSVPERLGDSWLAMKSGLAKGKIDALTYGLLDAVDGDRRIPQATQRREHLEMFTLLGDPALRLPTVARDLSLTSPARLKPGQELTVTGQAPERLRGGKVLLSLERPVSSVPTGLETLPSTRAMTDPARPGAEEHNRILNANHRRANRFVLDNAQVEISGQDGAFTARLSVPKDCPWPRLILRAYAADAKSEALGVLTLPVTHKAKP